MIFNYNGRAAQLSGGYRNITSRIQVKVFFAEGRCLRCARCGLVGVLFQNAVQPGLNANVSLCILYESVNNISLN